MADALARARSIRNVAALPNAVLTAESIRRLPIREVDDTDGTDDTDADVSAAARQRWATIVPAVAPPSPLPKIRQRSSLMRAVARTTRVRPIPPASPRGRSRWRHPSAALKKTVRGATSHKSFRITDSSANSSWRHRYRSEVWLHAAQTLWILLRNSLACVACIWCSTLFFSHGNVLSGKSAEHQSDFEFLAGTTVACHAAYYWLFLAAYTPALVPLEFVVLRERNRSTTFLFCVRRLVRHTFSVYVGSLALLVAYLALFRVSPPAVRQAHVQFYVSTACTFLYNTSIAIAVRRIFRNETVIGLSRQRLSSFQHPTCMRTAVSFIKMLARMAPMLGTVLLAGLYVQLTSGYQVNGDWDFLAYTLGSLAFKILIKEIAKLGIVRLKVQDPRTVFLVVGLPTVLVDTQVRIMLQRVQSTRYTLVWTFGMAALEIAMRLSKVLWTKRRLQRRGSRVASAVVTQVAVQTRGTSKGGAVATVVKKFGSLHDNTSDIQWKIHTVAFQIAESYANMSAEYIAIGCSTCVLFFYWDHPKYNLRDYRHNVDDSVASPNILWRQAPTLALQVGIEIVVDYISSVFEVGEGIDFHEIRRYRVYLGFLFVCIATVNIHICVMMYMDVH